MDGPLTSINEGDWAQRPQQTLAAGACETINAYTDDPLRPLDLTAMYTMPNGDYIPFEAEADNVGFTTQVFSSTPRHNSGSHRWVGTPTATGRSPGQAPRGWTTCTSRSSRSPPTDRPRPAQRRAQRHSTLAVRSAARPRPICTRATGQLGQFNALPSAKATAREHAPSTNGGFRVLSVMLAGRCACSARSGWSLTASG
jgi:hypothetical protein